jgi:hypothetical protein
VKVINLEQGKERLGATDYWMDAEWRNWIKPSPLKDDMWYWQNLENLEEHLPESFMGIFIFVFESDEKML